MRRRGVGPGIAEGAEAGLLAGDCGQRVEQVARAKTLKANYQGNTFN
jgi:hypothetical protein